jgi:hypothetical protein
VPNALGTMRTVQSVFSTANAVEGLNSYTGVDGKFVVEGMPVFKAGTFKDSMGYQQTWEPEHLEQMVFNFNMLRDRGTLPNVPVRDGHRSFLGSGGQVMGWITKLTHDQATGRLLADYEITEPDAAAKIQRGTYRARSAEIGMYETNDEATYWPVFMGFAFVDIPAVEGLYNREIKDGEYVLFTQHTKENAVPEKQPTPAAPAAPVTEPEGTEPPAAAEFEAPPAAEPPAAEPPAEPEGSGEHAAPAPGTVTFSVNGQPTNDFAAVQRHITALETAATESRDQGRRDYVAGLASGHKITQPQVDGLTTVALGLDDEAFAAFRAAYDAAPKQPVLAAHAGSTSTGTIGATAEESDDEIAVLRETIAQHQRAGVPEAQLSKMPSFIRLQALEADLTKE